jgi:hypothetical protein
MALSKFSYIPTVTGKQIDGYIKLHSQTDPKAYMGYWVWEGVLFNLYTDFVSTLALSIDNYIRTAEVIFAPVPGNVIVCPPTILATFMSLYTSSAITIDSNIKGQMSAMKPEIAAASSYIVWSEVLNQIGMDIMNVIPIAVSTSLEAGLVIAPAGASAPPVTSLLAPIPALKIIPFVPAMLMGLLQVSFNKGTLMAKAIEIDQKVKAEMKSFNQYIKPNVLDYNAMGEKIWKVFLDVLCPYIESELDKHIKMFLTIPGTNWNVPPGIPGPPFTPNPSISGLMPGTIV